VKRRWAVAAGVLLLAGLLAWDGSRRMPLGPAVGTGLAGAATGTSADDGRLTVMQFNIRRGRGDSGETDLARTAECLAGAELAGLNEVAGGAWLGQGPDQAAELGRLLGLGHVFLPTERRWWHAHFGNAILSTLAAREWRREPLPHAAGTGYRNVGLATIEWQGQNLQFLATHIDRGPDNERQLRALAERFAALPAPKILAGDLNAEADHPVIAAWLADPDLEVTSGEAAGAAPGGIDWIVAAGFEMVRAWRCDVGASDHWLVGAELEPRF